jgi:hypothetical protein
VYQELEHPIAVKEVAKQPSNYTPLLPCRPDHLPLPPPHPSTHQSRLTQFLHPGFGAPMTEFSRRKSTSPVVEHHKERIFWNGDKVEGAKYVMILSL